MIFIIKKKAAYLKIFHAEIIIATVCFSIQASNLKTLNNLPVANIFVIEDEILTIIFNISNNNISIVNM